jgi:hypothetical protein
LQRRGASGSGEGLHDVGGWRGEGVKREKRTSLSVATIN